MRGVALGGFMGTGKTTVGGRLASALGLPFVDMDAVLVERFGPIAEQFDRDGEAIFRRRERDLVAELAGAGPAVVATGGGAWVDGSSRALLAEHFLTVVLSAEVGVLKERVGAGGDRPLWGPGLEALLAERRAAYSDADLVVDTGARSVEQVVAAVQSALGAAPESRTVRVELGRRAYDVRLSGAGFEGLGEALTEAGIGADLVVVADPLVSALHGEALREALRDRTVRWVEPPAGEANKTVGSWQTLLDALLQPGFHRRTAVLALGGGVVGDLAGFAAATAMRGVPFVQLPTSLLAMVDSSVGGKTAVNHPSGKNLIGAFYQPRLVWAALPALGTLPRSELACGLAEAVKTAVIGDAPLLDRIEAHASLLGAGGARHVLADVVARSVRCKADVVAEDERETGRRAVLNLGHTVAHGLEAVLGAATGGPLKHGQAVAIGMVAEARFALARGWCEDPALPDRLARVLADLGLPTALPMTERDAVVAAMRLDKKASSDTLSLPVPVRAGLVRLVDLPLSELHSLLHTPESQ